MEINDLGVKAEMIENGIIDIITSQAKKFKSEITDTRLYVHFITKEKTFSKGTEEVVRVTTLFRNSKSEKPQKTTQRLALLTVLDLSGMISKMFSQIMKETWVNTGVCESNEISLLFTTSNGVLQASAMKNYKELIENVSIKEIFGEKN